MSMLFKRIKDWATSISAFRSGDVIPVDGPNGTAKMSKDDLLMETAENALAGNLAPAFDPAKENGPDGFAYHVDDTVIYDGRSFVFEKNKASGVWDDTYVREIPLSFIVGEILKKIRFIKRNVSSFDGELIEILDNDNKVVFSFDAKKVKIISVNGSLKRLYLGQDFLDRILYANEGIDFYKNNGRFLASFNDEGAFFESLKVLVGSRYIDVKEVVASAGISIYLPNVISAVVGDTIQIFFQGLVNNLNSAIRYNFRVRCTKGVQYPRYFEMTPSIEDVGDVNFTLQIIGIDNSLIAEQSCVIKVVDVVQNPSNQINVLCIGDSLTQDGYWCKEAFRRVHSTGGSPSGYGLDKINFVGKTVDDGVGFFGVGGWNWKNYCVKGSRKIRFFVSGADIISPKSKYTNNGTEFTVVENNTTLGVGNILCSISGQNDPETSGILQKVSGTGDSTISFSRWEEGSQNPFWNDDDDRLDVRRYVDTYCGGHVEYLYVLLGFNSLTAWGPVNAEQIAYAKIFINAVHSEYPDAKVKILGVEIPSTIGGLSANYGATGVGYGDYLGIVNAILSLNSAYRDLANENAYSEFVEYVDVASQFDSDYNLPSVQKNVNLRNSAFKEFVGTNGIHPNDAGYKQIADVVTRNLIKSLS